ITVILICHLSIREEMEVEPPLLQIERSQPRWLEDLFRLPLGTSNWEVFQACLIMKRLREDLAHAGQTIFHRLSFNPTHFSWQRAMSLLMALQGKQVWRPNRKALDLYQFLWQPGPHAGWSRKTKQWTSNICLCGQGCK
ncbi:hypothetical protein DNTS_024877, partial [Danionella cerebrum]